jgi:hypothetical protein
MRFTFTAVQVDGHDSWLVGYVEQLPGAVSRGAMIDDALTAVRQEADVTLAVNRRMTWEPFRDAVVVKRGQIKVGS